MRRRLAHSIGCGRKGHKRENVNLESVIQAEGAPWKTEMADYQLPMGRPRQVPVSRFSHSAFRVTLHAPCLRRAFTLVELLVVLAIIALLAALLLPTLARSKDSARRVQCAGGLHQLSLAARMYWDDNNGACFRWELGVTNGGRLYWFGWLQDGVEGQRQFDITQSALYPYLQGRGVEVCPAFNYSFSQYKLKATGASYGYGYNWYLSAPPRSPPINAGHLSHPSGTTLFADAAQVNTWQAPASPGNPMLEEWYYVDYADDNSEPANGHFRHAQKANVAFCDGHVALERFVAGSIDPNLPSQFVGRLRSEILLLP